MGCPGSGLPDSKMTGGLSEDSVLISKKRVLVMEAACGD
jgi:hypothetical protein